MIKRGLVYIRDSSEKETDLALGKDLILESDISLGISNDYQPLLSGGIASAISLVSSATKGKIPAGFRQQGFQVWRGSSPVELKLSVSLHMVTSGKLDVAEPAKSLIAYSVPHLKENGWGLVPPGASISAILGDGKIKELKDNYNIDIKNWFDVDSGKGFVSISIGNYLNLSQCIIKNVIPTYSLQEDSEGYPISCKLDIDISTLDIVNDKMIKELSL
ncbi:MAG: hypothetical protein PF569_07205 [Candidatus Woesearchaeota archaeon]|jgi:hypothetical protein|nr:hypothetical protein [Candidatus Woesearchaeota archaeon]